jgi:ferritin-like protein
VRGTERFVKELAHENQAFWARRDVRLDPDAPSKVLLSQIRYRMRQGVYNELRSVELIAAWIPWVPEREIRDLLPRQLEDEQRHYQLLRRRLKDLGEDPDAYKPLPEWAALFDWLVACRQRPTVEKLAMFQFAGETQSCEGFESLIRLAADLDPETAELYRTQILPDEYRHAAIGRQALLLLADTPLRQQQAREACLEMNLKVVKAYEAHRARADRGG